MMASWHHGIIHSSYKPTGTTRINFSAHLHSPFFDRRDTSTQSNITSLSLSLQAMKLISTSCLLLVRSSFAFSNKATATSTFHSTSSSLAQKSLYSNTALNMSSKPFSIIVEAEIKEERMDDFLKMIENNAKKSREEPGCIRFDVLRDQSKATKFWFYEVYENNDAVNHHKTTSHYQSWADFKESGGTVSSVSHKADGEFIGNKAS